MDIRPPQQPLQPEPVQASTPLSIEPDSSGLQVEKKLKRQKIFLFSGLGPLAILLILVAGGWFWYQSNLAPVGSDKNVLIKVTIEPKSTPATIGQLLKDKGLIRSAQAFSIYIRLSGTQNNLQAGAYRLSPAESTQQIVGHLKEGDVDTFNVTFLPGATLTQNRKVLIKAGYSDAEVTTALAATYDSPLFLDKPTSSDLEGYIYGETYAFSSDASVKDILGATFKVYAKVVEDNGLVAKFKTQHLSLYQGVTLASIVQRESSGNDAADIAQVFYNRLAEGIMLGSDVTYQYAADKADVPRDTNLDSPYNTRRYAGLPPGPIATPGKTALLGVASPSGHNYLFFLSGDDNVTYFASDLAGHEANIAAHCKVKCGIL